VSDPTPPGPPSYPPAGPPPGWTPPPSPTPRPTPPPSNTGLRALVVGLAVVAALLVVGVVLLAPRALDTLVQDGADASARATSEEASLADLLEVADLSTEHRDDEDIAYEQVPPIGGEHDDEWLACGAYDEPVRDENAVHDLEHGTVWITYDPDRVGGGEVLALEDALPPNGILSPYPQLPAPAVVTVWGVQLRLTGAADPRLPLFIEEYGDGSTSPEPFGSCEGGLERPEGDVQGIPV
jgi:hypothetical protein